MALIEPGPLDRIRAWLARRLAPTPTPTPPPPPTPQPVRDVVWRQDGPESGVWAEIVRRPDGLYSFAEWKRQWVTAPNAGTWETEFAIYDSGLYDSEDEARQAISDHIDWIIR